MRDGGNVLICKNKADGEYNPEEKQGCVARDLVKKKTFVLHKFPR